MQPISDKTREDFLNGEACRELNDSDNDLEDYEFPHSGCTSCVYNGGDICKRKICVYLEDL